jgi:hypothetical protein
LTTPQHQSDLAAIVGSIAGKLPLLIFLSTFVSAIATLYWGQTVLIPVVGNIAPQLQKEK